MDYLFIFEIVNKIFSIVLSSIILFQSLGIHYDDLVQIDDLLQHAAFHNDRYGDSLMVFLSKHYGELKTEHQREHQEEKDDHEKLPFNDHSHMTSITAFVLGASAAELNQLELAEYNPPVFHYQAPSSSVHSEGILQPPRFS